MSNDHKNANDSNKNISDEALSELIIKSNLESDPFIQSIRINLDQTKLTNNLINSMQNLLKQRVNDVVQKGSIDSEERKFISDMLDVIKTSIDPHNKNAALIEKILEDELKKLRNTDN